MAVRAALADIDAAVLPHRAGDYPNFVEVPADASASSRPTCGRACARSRPSYDPADVFAGNHHIPPAE